MNITSNTKFTRCKKVIGIDKRHLYQIAYLHSFGNVRMQIHEIVEQTIAKYRRTDQTDKIYVSVQFLLLYKSGNDDSCSN